MLALTVEQSMTSAPRAQRRRQCVDDFPHVGSAETHSDDRVAIACKLGGRMYRHAQPVSCGERFGLREGSIENRGEKTGLVKIGRHVSAHGAESR